MMRKTRLPALAFLGLACLSGFAAEPAKTSSVWPEVTQTAKPWTRWWWPGSAVDKPSLSYQLNAMAQAGLGGVEITPIYGAKGAEDRYIPFLSPTWMEMLGHTGREARKLGLGVDMATGTGWPFGGPWIKEADALSQATLQDGRITGKPTGMKVKRAAPGGEGLVIDPYSTVALQHYLQPFSEAFASFPRELIRGQFHDSFEYYNASWTPTFAGTFKEMHGYDVQTYAAELMGEKPLDDATLARIKGDYRATLARLHFDYLSEWVKWSHARGFIVRNQSHGSPANLLDLYGVVDIPETEIFGSTPFPIPGLRRDLADVRQDQDLPEALVIKMASSAAHVMGHPLASSETCTWLREHWKEALAFTKPEIDRLFAEGINHILYHGTVYSPKDAAWPGWLFYASTQFNPNNPLWGDFSALNTYVTRVQSVLQSGRPDNDVLLYWPFADVLEEPKGLMMQFGVHNVSWLTESSFGKTASALAKNGYALDYISDAQLQGSKAVRGEIQTSGQQHYRVLIVPAAKRMPVETLRQILQLARAKVPIHMLALPEDVPGFGNLDVRRAEFAKLIAEAKQVSMDKRCRFSIGPGAGADALNLTILAQVAKREAMAGTGLSFIRRASASGYDYFMTNLTGQPVEGWFALGAPAKSVALLDPLTGRAGDAALRKTATNITEVRLQVAPGESFILRTRTKGAPAVREPWAYLKPAGDAAPLTGRWSVEFVKGGPVIPAAVQTKELKSWTEFGNEEAQRFAGTACYSLEFDAPTQTADDWMLDLGDVRESARVRLNGKEVTVAWSLPFRLRVGAQLKPGRNLLEIDVTNLAANRIRDLDRRGVNWKIMREINFVNIRYKPFDASQWELTPSGLLGPVTLTPLKLSALP